MESWIVADVALIEMERNTKKFQILKVTQTLNINKIYNFEESFEFSTRRKEVDSQHSHHKIIIK